MQEDILQEIEREMAEINPDSWSREKIYLRALIRAKIKEYNVRGEEHQEDSASYELVKNLVMGSLRYEINNVLIGMYCGRGPRLK